MAAGARPYEGFEVFPTRDGETPSDFIRNELARGCIVIQMYGSTHEGIMLRSQAALSRHLIEDAEQTAAALHLWEYVRRMWEAGVPKPAQFIDDVFGQ